MARLRWTSDRYRFVDHGRAFVADEPGVYEVPDDAVDDYLEHIHGSWERADDEADASAGDASDETETETETETEADGGEPEPDPEDLAEAHWQQAVSQIQSGVVDGQLDAVEHAEQERDAPRKSVMEAIDDRRDEIGDA